MYIKNHMPRALQSIIEKEENGKERGLCMA